MRILQFVCPQDPPATELKELIVKQFNAWSRLKWLSNDENYMTAKFDLSTWKESATVSGLWWLNYDDVYSVLGDDGRVIADNLFGDLQFQGYLKAAPLVHGYPDTQLKIVNVADLVAAGYELPINDEI